MYCMYVCMSHKGHVTVVTDPMSLFPFLRSVAPIVIPVAASGREEDERSGDSPPTRFDNHQRKVASCCTQSKNINNPET